MLGFSRSSFMVVFVVMFGSPYSAANAESDTHASIPSAHTIVLIHFILGHITTGIKHSGCRGLRGFKPVINFVTVDKEAAPQSATFHTRTVSGKCRKKRQSKTYNQKIKWKNLRNTTQTPPRLQRGVYGYLFITKRYVILR